MSFVETSTGEIIAIADTTGESISVAMAWQIAANRAEQSIRFAAKTKELNEKINKKLKPNKENVEALHKETEPFLSSEKLVNVERLKATKDIKQIEDFRTYTDNFKNLDKLKPEEILYLNLCDWLAPQAATINAELGVLKFIDPATKVEVFIKELDLFHSLLGEMRPGSIKKHTSGGHLLIPELRAAMLDVDKIEHIGKDFFDMSIKYAGKQSEKYVSNTYFPMGTSIEQSVSIIKDTIKNNINVSIVENIKDESFKGFKLTNQQNQVFVLLTQNETAQFYPYKI